MSKALAIRGDGEVPAELQEKVLMGGDLSKLTIPERLSYYKAVCESVGLNPLTRPFEYLVLDDRLVLYARKDCTDQLRELHGISIEIASRERVEDLFVVTARARNLTERVDESIGAVPAVKEDGDWKTSQSGKRYFQGNGTYKPLNLEARSNAMMKAETKAKRRVTLSICGLGVMDESELDGLPNVKRAVGAEDPDKKHSLQEMYALTHEVTPEQPNPFEAKEVEALPAQEPAPEGVNIFQQSSAIADHETALDEAKTNEELHKAWDDCVKDTRLTSETRPGLYKKMTALAGKMKKK